MTKFYVAEKFVQQIVKNNDTEYINAVYDIVKEHECKTTVTQHWILVCIEHFQVECIDEILQLKQKYENEKQKD